MHRYGLRDDQWEQIRDFLAGRKGMSAALPQTIGSSSRP